MSSKGVFFFNWNLFFPGCSKLQLHALLTKLISCSLHISWIQRCNLVFLFSSFLQPVPITCSLVLDALRGRNQLCSVSLLWLCNLFFHPEKCLLLVIIYNQKEIGLIFLQISCWTWQVSIWEDLDRVVMRKLEVQPLELKCHARPDLFCLVVSKIQLLCHQSVFMFNFHWIQWEFGPRTVQKW